MKVKVNQDKCIGCGACVATCEDNFEMQDNGKAKEIHSDVPENLKQCTQEASDSCPVEAIEIQED